MTREESWQVEGTTLTLLRHITAMGFAVSVFNKPDGAHVQFAKTCV